jgi:glycosyltransferase involved in cell wall biosynthesis
MPEATPTVSELLAVPPSPTISTNLTTRQPRVAIIHYWLVGMRGGERVLERLLRLYPQADIFTHVYDPASVSDLIRSKIVKTSFIQRLPGAVTRYKSYLPLMPMALEELDLRGYDLVISSESGPAKGVLAPPDAFHLTYCHSPMRYVWDHYHEYRETAGRLTKVLMPYFAHRIRQWDFASAQRVDAIVANSKFVKDRIKRNWNRDAVIVYPPVDTALYRPTDDIENRYLWVGQMTRYKRADLAVDAFNRLGLPLLMVGDGELSADLKQRAKANIEIVDRLNFDQLRAAYARAKALIFTAEEDFGIVPVEAMASGRPVLAFGRGGARDSVDPDITGLFFDEQSVDSLVEGIERLEAWLPNFDPGLAVSRSKLFSPERFDEGILAAIPA